MVSLVRELAAYEQAEHEVELDAAALQEHLFGDGAQVFAHVAEERIDGRHEVVGLALWFVSFSTWRGRHGIYLEDLFVRPEARGQGHGRALLAALAQMATDRGYARVEWSVLNWNEPAHGFYRRLGAAPMDGWTVWRLTGSALEQLGARS